MDWRLVCPSAAHIARVCPSVRHITWRHEREGAVVRQSRVFGVVADAVVLDGFLQPPTSGQTAHENAIEELRHLGTLARILTSSNFTPMLTDAHACAPGHVCVCTQTDIHSRTRTSRHQTREKRPIIDQERPSTVHERPITVQKRPSTVQKRQGPLATRPHFFQRRSHVCKHLCRTARVCGLRVLFLVLRRLWRHLPLVLSNLDAPQPNLGFFFSCFE